MSIIRFAAARLFKIVCSLKTIEYKMLNKSKREEPFSENGRCKKQLTKENIKVVVFHSFVIFFQ